jgi:hypothetical protein
MKRLSITAVVVATLFTVSTPSTFARDLTGGLGLGPCGPCADA